MKQFAINIVKKLVDAGFIAYFAGGWVRDFILKVKSDDIDIATSAPVEKIIELFPRTIPVGVSFGVVIVVEGGYNFEIATFRTDKEYLNGRRPSGIELASPKEDAKRRDFTINGLFYDPLKDEIIDFVNGREDIQKKLIRAIGNPEKRFEEDRLRMVRAARYATRFNFKIEEKTKKAIIKNANTLFPSVALERIWQEFNKMAKFSNFGDSILMLYKLSLLQVIFPKTKSFSIDYIQERTNLINKIPLSAPTILKLIEVFQDLSLEELEELTEYLKLSNKDKECAVFFHKTRNMLNMPKTWLNKVEPIEWVNFYASPLSDQTLKVLASQLASEKDKFLDWHHQKFLELEKYIERVRNKYQIVNSEMLKKEGILPGKQLGLLLKEAQKIEINQKIDDPQQIISLLKKTNLWK